MFFIVELYETELTENNLTEDDITDALTTAIKNLGINQTHSRRLGVTRDDWNEGDPCPSCGSRRIHALYAGSDELRSEDDELTYADDTGWSDNYIRYQCLECFTTLDANAPADLME
jgi:DNA-directed RNA polymerase subunit RPC12/RpoP